MTWGDVCRDSGDIATALEHFEAAAAQFATSGLDEELRRAQSSINEMAGRARYGT